MSIHFPVNQSLIPNTMTLTIGEFYDYYASPSHIAMISNIPAIWKPLKKMKTSLLCWEMYIDHSAVSITAQNLMAFASGPLE